MTPILATLPSLLLDPAASAPAQESGLLGAALGLVLGVIQFLVGLSIAAFAINKGFALVSRMLDGLNIWSEIKKRNVAVALLAAGVVLSYTNVIGGGIASMTGGLGAFASADWSSGVSAIVGGVFNLVVALLVAGFGISVTFKVMDKLTTDIDEKQELRSGNVAIGVVYAGILIGVSSMISAGVSGIGGGLTKFLDTLI